MPRNNRPHYLTFVSGLILVMLGAVCAVTQLANAITSLVFINAGLIMAVVSMLKFNKMGAGPRQDERTRHLSSVSLSYSWLITFVMLHLMFWVNWLEFIDLDLTQGTAVVLFVMIVSAAFIKWYLNTRGYRDEK